MSELIRIAAIFSLSLVAANFALAGLCRIAPKLRLLDHPNRRKKHFHPRPQVGGLGIILAVSLCAPLFAASSGLWGVYAGIIMLTLVGYIDDAKPLNHRWKFAAQVLAASGMIYFSRMILLSFGDVLGVGALDLHYAAIPVTLFCAVGVVNAVNMIDGLDGLLGGISLIAFSSFAVLAFINGQTELLLLSVAFSGALIAFLRYNWGYSRLFMGDAGSLSIGFTLVFLSLAISQKANSLVPPVAPLLILAVPIVDAVTVFTKRLMNGRQPFSADRSHLHHMLQRFGFSKKQTVMIILSLSAVLATLGIAGTALKLPDRHLFSIFVVYVGLYAVIAASIKDVVEAKLKIRKGRTGYQKPALLTITLMQLLDSLRSTKRKHPRHALRLPVVCSIQGRSFSGTVLDIGWGGFSARLPRGLRFGETMDASILLMGDDSAVRFSSTVDVMWSLKSGGGYLCGLKYLSLKPDHAATLKKYLERVRDNPSGNDVPDAPSYDRVLDPISWTFEQRTSEPGGSGAACDHPRETIEIAGIRCTLVFEEGFFHKGIDAILSSYRRWGFCTGGEPDITITIRNSPVPRPDDVPETTFYYSTEYDSVSATFFFDAEALKGTVGIVALQTDILTPLRIVELIETYITTVYLFYLFLHGRGTLIHSSGICDNGSAYIFAGPSGNGKSTIARLSHPRTVLCDDLVVLRKEGDGSAKVYGTPFAGDHESVNKGAECKALFFIEKSTANEVMPMSRMSAVVELLKEGVIGNLLSLPDIARVFPYSKMLTHLIDLLEGVPCYRLRFTKDATFWEVIRGQHQQTAEKA